MSKKTDTKKNDTEEVKSEVAQEIKSGAKAFEEAKKADLVSLEMTKEEADEFALFKLKKDQDAILAEEKTKEEELYVINLTYQHHINGNSFGPGRTQVPKKYIGLLQHGEQNLVRNEIRLNQSSDNFFKVSMQGGGVRKVSSLPV